MQFLQQRWKFVRLNLFPEGKGCCGCSFESIFVSPAAVPLGYGPYPRHCLAVVLSSDTAKNACLRQSRSCTRSSFFCGPHLFVCWARSHGTVSRTIHGRATTKLLFCVCALLLLCTIIYLLQSWLPNQLLNATPEYILYTYLDATTVQQQLHFKSLPLCERRENCRCLGVTLYCTTTKLYCCIVLKCCAVLPYDWLYCTTASATNTVLCTTAVLYGITVLQYCTVLYCIVRNYCIAALYYYYSSTVVLL